MVETLDQSDLSHLLVSSSHPETKEICGVCGVCGPELGQSVSGIV